MSTRPLSPGDRVRFTERGYRYRGRPDFQRIAQARGLVLAVIPGDSLTMFDQVLVMWDHPIPVTGVWWDSDRETLVGCHDGDRRLGWWVTSKVRRDD